MTNYFEKVKQFIDNNPQLILPMNAVAATDIMIEQIEKKLSLKFCGEYLRFIREWGTISLAGCYHEYFALYEFNEQIFYWVMKNAKYCWEKGLPHSYIPVVSDEGDEFYCLEPSTYDNQTVYAWDVFSNEFCRKESDSLFELIWCDIEKNGIPNSLKDGRLVNI